MTHGAPLEILRDAIYGTDLIIEIVEKNVLVYRRKEGL